MAPRTHIIKGERPPIEDYESADSNGFFGGRDASEVAKDITLVHEEILARRGEFLEKYSLRPANREHGDTLYIVVDYPEPSA